MEKVEDEERKEGYKLKDAVVMQWMIYRWKVRIDRKREG